MSKGIKLRGKTWYADFRFNGRRVRDCLDTSSEAEAERKRDELKARLWKEPRVEGVSWDDAKVKWIKEAPRPVQDLLSLKLFDQYYPNRPLARCTVESFELALAVISRERSWTPATYNRYLNRVVAIANLSKHPLKIDKKKIPRSADQRMRVLTHDEWDRLYDELPAHMKPMVKMALYTGLRQQNILQLRWENVDLEREMLWIHADEAKEGEVISIPLADEALDVLRGQVDKHKEWVFPYHGKPVVNINHAWHMAMERAGLGYYERWKTPDGKLHELWHGDFVWHGLRHSWASWQRVAGTPLEDIQALGGWRDPRSVARYAHVNVDHLRKAAKNIKPWSK